MNPLISILIPTYNRGHLISETLDSVLAQTYTNWECIVVDDGSNDNTIDVVTNYSNKDARFQYYQRPTNRFKGANTCRNYGFELSKGDYINWFDDDDIMLPTKLERQIVELNNSAYSYCICQTMMFDVKTNRNMGLRATSITSNNIFEDYILFKSFWLTGAPLWKRDFLIENQLTFDEDLHQAQDYDFHMRVLEVSKNYIPIEDYLVIFKYHGENMSNSATDSALKLFSNAKIKFNIFKKYKKKLSKDSLHKNYLDLLALYKFSVRKKQYKNSFFIFKTLISNIDVLKYSLYVKFVLVTKLCMSLFLFVAFSKGERFLKFNV